MYTTSKRLRKVFLNEEIGQLEKKGPLVFCQSAYAAVIPNSIAATFER